MLKTLKPNMWRLRLVRKWVGSAPWFCWFCRRVPPGLADDDDDGLPLRSSRYSELMLEAPSAPPTQQEAPPSLDLSANQLQSEPAAASSPQQNLPAEAAAEPEPEPESGPMLLLSESLEEAPGAGSEPSDVPLDQNLKADASEVQPGEPQAEPALGSGPEPSKPKKDKLTRLKELGLDPPPVAKLSPDDGAFVRLEPPQSNPGNGGVAPGWIRSGSILNSQGSGLSQAWRR